MQTAFAAGKASHRAQAASRGAGPVGSPEIRIAAWTEKPEFTQGEPIPLHVRWENPAPPGGPSVTVNRRGLLRAETSIEVRDGLGKILAIDKRPEGRPLRQDDFLPLEPGDGFAYVYLLDWLLAARPGPGVYTARVAFRDGPRPDGPPAWAGTLALEPLRFRISPKPRSKPGAGRKGRTGPPGGPSGRPRETRGPPAS